MFLKSYNKNMKCFKFVTECGNLRKFRSLDAWEYKNPVGFLAVSGFHVCDTGGLVHAQLFREIGAIVGLPCDNSTAGLGKSYYVKL